jgi:hypothetical protein
MHTTQNGIQFYYTNTRFLLPLVGLPPVTEDCISVNSASSSSSAVRQHLQFLQKDLVFVGHLVDTTKTLA